PHAGVCAEARGWHDVVLHHRWTADIRHAPLAVLLQGEAGNLLNARLTANQMTAVLSAGGTHPYVLKVLGRFMLSLPGDPLSAISTAGERLVTFFQACRQALRQGAEEALLRHLVQEVRPINPRDGAVAVQLPNVKSKAEALS